MPRRQRFKPSRKPKPIVNDEAQGAQQQQTTNYGVAENQPPAQSFPQEPEDAAK